MGVVTWSTSTAIRGKRWDVFGARPLSRGLLLCIRPPPPPTPLLLMIDIAGVAEGYIEDCGMSLHTGPLLALIVASMARAIDAFAYASERVD
jgi:hypothetical protein